MNRRISASEQFSKEELNFRKMHQQAVADWFGVKPSKVRVIGNSLNNVVEHENTVSIGTTDLGNPNYEYFYIYQKRKTVKHCHSSENDYISGYVVTATELSTIYREAESSGRVERILAPRQNGRTDILTRLPYAVFENTTKFMIV
jgi:hypothetical protein